MWLTLPIEACPRVTHSPFFPKCFPPPVFDGNLSLLDIFSHFFPWDFSKWSHSGHAFQEALARSRAFLGSKTLLRTRICFAKWPLTTEIGTQFLSLSCMSFSNSWTRLWIDAEERQENILSMCGFEFSGLCMPPIHRHVSWLLLLCFSLLATLNTGARLNPVAWKQNSTSLKKSCYLDVRPT